MAKKIKPTFYLISNDSSKVKHFAEAVLGREIAFQSVPSDRTFELSPTLRCKIVEGAYASIFYIEKFKSRELDQLRSVVEDIASQIAQSKKLAGDKLLFVITDTNLLGIYYNGNLTEFSFSSTSDLMTSLERQKKVPRVRAIIRELQAIHLPSSLPEEFADVLESGLFEKLNHFLVEKLNWGKSVDLSQGAQKLTNQSLSLYKPISEIQDHILVMHWPESVRGTKEPRKAHRLARSIADIMDNHSKQIALALVFGGKDAVLIAPHQSWDLRVQFHRTRLREQGWVRSCATLLHSNNIPVKNQSKEIDHQQLLYSRELDDRFNALCSDFRLCLLRDMISNHKTFVSDCLNFFREKSEPTVNKSNVDQLVLKDRNKQALFVSVVDSIVLRTIVRRFIEVYHVNPFDLEFDSILKMHGEFFDTPRENVGKMFEGKLARFDSSARVKPGHEKELKNAFKALGDKYRTKYAGDMHFSKVASAVDYLESQLTPDYLAQLLDITNAKRYKFQYDDLRPDALEEYYQKTLETSVELQLKDDKLEPVVLVSKSARKELGAFFTPALASEFTIKLSMTKLLDKRTAKINEYLNKMQWEEASSEIIAFLNIRCVDPTVGGASFLKQVFKEFTKVHRAEKLNSWIHHIPTEHQERIKSHFNWYTPDFAFRDFEEHVMKNCLYGVDIDFKGLTIGAYTLTLEALNYMEGSEKFPSLLNRTLKQGNALVNWLEPDEWKSINSKFVKELLSLRQKASIAEPEKLVEVLQEAENLKENILKNFKEKRKQEWGCDPSSLNPFCWELEFPEVFYDAHGKPKDNPGFDVVVGNPPWENLKGTEPEFFSKIDVEWPTGKNVSKQQEQRKIHLLKSKLIKQEFDDYFKKLECYQKFLSQSSQYICIDPKYPPGTVRGGNGDPNTYKLACERFVKLANHNACYGFVVPEGIASDKGNRDLRRLLTTKGITDLIGFSKENLVFVGVTQAFVIVSGECCNLIENIKYITGNTDLYQAIENHSKMTSTAYKVMRKLGMATEPFVSLNSEVEVKLLNVLINSVAENSLRLKGYNELHTTKDMDLTQGSSHQRKYFVIKGADTGRFLPPKLEELQYKLNESEYRKRHPSRAQFLEQERVVWHSISGTTDRRRMVAAVIPPGVACFHSINLIDPNVIKNSEYYVTGVINSFCYEWLVRLVTKNNNVSIYVVESLPIPNFDSKNFHCVEVEKLSKQLHRLPEENTVRRDYEAQLEAHVAHIYNLEKDELEQLMFAFPKVDDAYKALVLRHFQSSFPKQDKVA